MQGSSTGLQERVGRWLARILPEGARRAFADGLYDRAPHDLLEVFAPRLNRKPDLDNMPLDLDVNSGLEFEHLSGLFSSTSLDHAIVSMTVRQTAYLFGLVKQMQARKVIEIGRYKGGATVTIAAAMQGRGEFWSIDNGEKEDRLSVAGSRRSFDEQVRDLCKRFGLGVHLLVGDSRTLEVDTGVVDLVFIDGDHSYEGVRTDFERFGRRVRPGGAVLFDDAFDDGIFRTHAETVGRLVNEITGEGQFKLAKAVNRLAHLERVRV